MAMTGCTESIIKEFTYLNSICVRLVQGFKENEVPAYYAIFKRTGLNLPLGHADHGRIEEVLVLAPTLDQYQHCAEKFKEIVSTFL